MPKKSSINFMKIVGIIGPLIYKGEISKHFDAKELANPNFIFLDYEKGFQNSEYQQYHELENMYITCNESRNNAIISYTKNCLNNNKKVLILTKRVDHGNKLAEELGTTYIYGGTKESERQQTIKDFENSKTTLIIASRAVFGEGIDLKNGVDVIILTSSDVSSIPVIQGIGRALRKNKNMEVDIIDLYDRSHKTFQDHSDKRIKIIKVEYNKIPKMIKI